MVRYRYPGAAGQAGNCVMPKMPNGDAEVMASVMSEEVADLMGAEGFGKYLEAS